MQVKLIAAGDSFTMAVTEVRGPVAQAAGFHLEMKPG